tara:strand:- start:51 stop:770 length:720 start_codon:yes stop_codon:yes gene_type:complete
MRTFTKVTPTMTASIQHAGVYADTNILFDWHKVEGFKGGSVDNIKLILRGTNGVDQTVRAIDLLFATSHIPTLADGVNVSVDITPPSLGTQRAAVTTFGWQNNLVGLVSIATGDFNDGDLVVLNTANKDLSGMEIPVSGDLYVAALAKDSAGLDFRSTVTCTGVQPITQSTLTVGTTSALINFAPGDVLHDENDRLMGTVKTVTNANTMTMTKNLENATVNATDLYALSPIQLILGGTT